MSVDMQVMVEDLENSFNASFNDEEWGMVLQLFSLKNSDPKINNEIIAAQFRVLCTKSFYLFIKKSIETSNYPLLEFLISLKRYWQEEFKFYLRKSPLEFALDCQKWFKSDAEFYNHYQIVVLLLKKTDRLRFDNLKFDDRDLFVRTQSFLATNDPVVRKYLLETTTITVLQVISLIQQYHFTRYPDEQPRTISLDNFLNNVSFGKIGQRYSYLGCFVTPFVVKKKNDSLNQHLRRVVSQDLYHPSIYKPYALCIPSNDTELERIVKFLVPNSSAKWYQHRHVPLLSSKLPSDSSIIFVIQNSDYFDYKTGDLWNWPNSSYPSLNARVEKCLRLTEALLELQILNMLPQEDFTLSSVFFSCKDLLYHPIFLHIIPGFKLFDFFRSKLPAKKEPDDGWRYWPPEHIINPKNKIFTVETLVYSLGCIIYYYVTSRKMWPGCKDFKEVSMVVDYNYTMARQGRSPRSNIIELLNYKDFDWTGAYKTREELAQVLDRLFDLCFCFYPRQRPTLIHVIGELKKCLGMLPKFPAPPNKYHNFGLQSIDLKTITFMVRGKQPPEFREMQENRKKQLANILKDFGSITEEIDFTPVGGETLKILKIEKPASVSAAKDSAEDVTAFVTCGLWDPNLRDDNRSMNFELLVAANSSEVLKPYKLSWVFLSLTKAIQQLYTWPTSAASSDKFNQMYFYYKILIFEINLKQYLKTEFVAEIGSSYILIYHPDHERDFDMGYRKSVSESEIQILRVRLLSIREYNAFQENDLGEMPAFDKLKRESFIHHRKLYISTQQKSLSVANPIPERSCPVGTGMIVYDNSPEAVNTGGKILPPSSMAEMLNQITRYSMLVLGKTIGPKKETYFIARTFLLLIRKRKELQVWQKYIEEIKISIPDEHRSAGSAVSNEKSKAENTAFKLTVIRSLFDKANVLADFGYQLFMGFIQKAQELRGCSERKQANESVENERVETFLETWITSAWKKEVEQFLHAVGKLKNDLILNFMQEFKSKFWNERLPEEDSDKHINIFPHAEAVMKKMTAAYLRYEPSFGKDDRFVCDPRNAGIADEPSCGVEIFAICSWNDPRFYHGKHSKAFVDLLGKQNPPLNVTYPNETRLVPVLTFSKAASKASAAVSAVPTTSMATATTTGFSSKVKGRGSYV